MPLRLEDTFYLEAPLKVYVRHKYINNVVKTDANLAGTNRTILSSITLTEPGDWKLVGYGRFKHPVANGKYLYTWIDNQANWSVTEWNAFLGDNDLKQTFQGIKFESTEDYVNIHINTVVTISDTTTFNWSFTADDNTTGIFFDTSSNSNNPLITSIQSQGNVENQAHFCGIKISS